jgi:hypothetical protein
MTADFMNQKTVKWEHLVWAAGGALAGAWWVNNVTEEAKKSRAELDDPDSVRKVCRKVGRVLDRWRTSNKCTSEESFVRHLAYYLENNMNWEIETWPDTDEGCPDILIGDLLALELKVNPGKAERDRCVGQCAGYSREWVTWIVLIDSPASRLGRLERLLLDKGLEKILVWNFR